VYDTKYLSAAHPLCCDIEMPELLSICPLPPTSLEYLALWARGLNPDPQLKLCTLPHRSKLIIALHHKHLRYGVHELQHEAGYDAFMTAQVFLSLSAEMAGRGKVPTGEMRVISAGGILLCIG
jgi:hypothetical protein